MLDNYKLSQGEILLEKCPCSMHVNVCDIFIVLHFYKIIDRFIKAFCVVTSKISIICILCTVSYRYYVQLLLLYLQNKQSTCTLLLHLRLYKLVGFFFGVHNNDLV